MAAPESKIATVLSKDEDVSTAEVKVLIPELTVDKSMVLFGTKKPGKNCKVEVTIEESSLEVTAEVKDKKGYDIKYRYKCNELPSKVDTVASKYKYEKGMVVITLKKQDELSWEVQLSKSGLDQKPDTD